MLLLFHFIAVFLIAQNTVSAEGIVLDAVTGEPVEDVDVSAAVSEFDSAPITVMSDAKGRFVFPNLPTGKYRLTTLRAGYVSVRPEGRRSPLDAGVWITTRQGQPLKDVVLRIFRAGAISGRVLDARGQPVVNAEANLIRQSYDDRGRQISQPQYLGRDLGGGTTNDRGEFRIFGIPAGEYRVRISPDISETVFQPNAGDEIEQETYYPGVPDFASAGPVRVEWGSEIRLSDMTVPMLKAGPVKLKIVNETGVPEGESDFRSFEIYRDGQVIAGVISGASLTGGSGRFELRGGLPPGKYDIRLGWGGNESMEAGRATIEVSGTEVTGNIVVRKAPVVTGKLLLQGPGGTQPLAASIRLESGSIQLAARANSSGAFSIRGVPVGEYDASFGRLPDGAFIKNVRANGSEVSADRIPVQSETSLELVFASAGATVEGVVKNSKGLPISGAAVVLVPEGPAQELSQMYRTTHSDLSGHFTLDDILPGTYFVYAWMEMDGAAYRNADFMKRFESRGQALRIRETEAVQMDVPLADEESPQ